LDIYLKRRRGKILLLTIAILIGVTSLVYTSWLTRKMAEEERKKVELWAAATHEFIDAGIEITSPEMEQLNTKFLNFLNIVVAQNTTIPIIIIEKDSIFNLYANINYKPERRLEVLKMELQKMKEANDPIPIKLSEENVLMLYYRESSILRNLRYYPYIQLFVIIIFIVVAYFAFHATQRAEQNQVWVGMSKETAHQLGTPISSLMAWVEILKLQHVDQSLIDEFEKDIERLERITERFSKIGSKPELHPANVIVALSSTVRYLKSRSSEKVVFNTRFNENEIIEVPLNIALFSWVIENICKNAIDAMSNQGAISIDLKKKDGQVIIDITDTGKGVPKSQFITIFQPGFSTKKRGWGLGLSLAKRIIENYHNGKIFIKWSEIGKGTTFRIILDEKVK